MGWMLLELTLIITPICVESDWISVGLESVVGDLTLRSSGGVIESPR